MKTRDRLDKILRSSCERIQDEVASLIGKPFKVGEPEFNQVRKEDLFAEAGGKSILAHVRMDGEVEGQGCLLVRLADAIRIGGMLIMLPDAELDSVVAAEEYSEELQDSFGEVANIICGGVTSAFEEQFAKKIRFIRTEQETIVPVKVVADSDQPVPDGEYYVMTVPMEAEGHELGRLIIALPASPLGLALVTPTAADSDEAQTEKPSSQEATSPPVEADGTDQRATEIREAAPAKVERSDSESAVDLVAEQEPAAPVQSERPKRDIGKQKKLIDNLLGACLSKIGEDVSGLLGSSLQIVPLVNEAHTKASFLEQADGKQVLARMNIRGEAEGEAFLFLASKSAIHLGGSLIMLPQSELDESVRNENFNDDIRDAYGEITNIIAGAYTAVFEEQYRTRLGFVRDAMEVVVPAKVDPETDDVFADQGYYLSTGQVTYNGADMGRLQMLVPAKVFDLDGLLTEAEGDQKIGSESSDIPIERTGAGSAAGEEPVSLRPQAASAADILIYTDDDREGDRIVAAAQQLGYAARMLHFKDPVASVLTPQVQLVFLVMKEVSEQGFGVAIKLNSAGLRVPLVAAGPAWTRSLVLKAVKYGAGDILVTPPSADDVREKIESNLIKRAA